MQPKVIALMLTTGKRPTITERAIRSFESQLYENKMLMSYCGNAGFTIGELRNSAIRATNGDIVAHFDEDDWSHPNRIAEQVALLQASGADCVGYREMLLWRTRIVRDHLIRNGFRPDDPAMMSFAHVDMPGEAWIYTNPEPDFCLGTSLCYWRRVWESKPFEALGDEWKWQQGLRRRSITSLIGSYPNDPYRLCGPRMIVSIHNGSRLDSLQQQSFRRAPAWDAHCRRIMESETKGIPDDI